MFSNSPISALPFSAAADVLFASSTTDGADIFSASLFIVWADVVTNTSTWQTAPSGSSNSWGDVDSSSVTSWQNIAA